MGALDCRDRIQVHTRTIAGAVAFLRECSAKADGARPRSLVTSHRREGCGPCFSLVQCNSARSAEFDDGEGPSVGQPIDRRATTLESLAKLIESDEFHFCRPHAELRMGQAVMAHFYRGHGGNVASLFCPRS